MSKFPRVDYITFETELPGHGKVKFRPFTIGEHKRLLEAIGIGDHMGVINTLESILTSCTFGKLDLSKLEMYLIDWLYLQVYIKSVGETSDIEYTCRNPVGENEDGSPKTCDTSVIHTVHLDKAYLHFPDNYTEKKVVEISKTGGLKLRQPTIEQFKKLKSDSEYQLTDEFIFSCIECFYEGDNVTVPGTDFTMEEVAEYLETLPENVIDQITDFLNNTPTLRIDLEFKCPKCEYVEKITLEGLEDFFD